MPATANNTVPLTAPIFELTIAKAPHRGIEIYDASDSCHIQGQKDGTEGCHMEGLGASGDGAQSDSIKWARIPAARLNLRSRG